MMTKDSLSHYCLGSIYSLGGLFAALLAAASVGCCCDPCGGGICSTRFQDTCGGYDSCGGGSCGGCGSCGSCGSCGGCDISSLFGCWPCGRNWCGGGCGDCCESTSGCGRFTGRDINRHYSCGMGCGDMYWGEAAAPHCDSCDCDGNFIGTFCRSPLQNMHDGWRWFWGYGCGCGSPCGSTCGGGCGCGYSGHGDSSYSGGCASCGHGGGEHMTTPLPTRMQHMDMPPQPEPDMEMKSTAVRRGNSRVVRTAPAQVHIAQPTRPASKMRYTSHAEPMKTSAPAPRASASNRPATQYVVARSQPTATGKTTTAKAGARVVRFQTSVKDASAPLTYEIELKEGETLVEAPVITPAK